jgi:hypothetical protein
MIDITVVPHRVAEFCRNHSTRPLKIEILDDAVIGEDGDAVFERYFELRLILIYRGSLLNPVRRIARASCVRGK